MELAFFNPSNLIDATAHAIADGWVAGPRGTFTKNGKRGRIVLRHYPHSGGYFVMISVGA